MPPAAAALVTAAPLTDAAAAAAAAADLLWRGLSGLLPLMLSVAVTDFLGDREVRGDAAAAAIAANILGGAAACFECCSLSGC
jgi:hypothetical protein